MAVMAAHSPELTAKSRMETYQQLRRALRPGHLPGQGPQGGQQPGDALPPARAGSEKLFCFLYPSELMALLRGTNAAGRARAVPLGRRVLYALATYTRPAEGEPLRTPVGARRLRPRHARQLQDEDGGRTVLRGGPRARRGAPALARVPGKPEVDQPIVRDEDIAYDRKRLALTLRDDLKAVGVTRAAILFEEDEPTVEPLPVPAYDLRSTFCTWARRPRQVGHLDQRADGARGERRHDQPLRPWCARPCRIHRLRAVPRHRGRPARARSVGYRVGHRPERGSLQDHNRDVPTDDVVTRPSEPSQVVDLVRDRGVGGSNPLAPTLFGKLKPPKPSLGASVDRVLRPLRSDSKTRPAPWAPYTIEQNPLAPTLFPRLCLGSEASLRPLRSGLEDSSGSLGSVHCAPPLPG